MELTETRAQREASLRKELADIEAEKEREAAAAREKLEKLILENIDALIALKPEHGRTSCDDVNLNNQHGRCDRCALLAIKVNQYVPDDLDIELNIRRRAVR